MDYLIVAAGLCLLLIGGEFLVRGAVSLARRLGVSPLIIGLTIVAYGTSAPELLVSLEANLAGASGIAIGNVVGSNIANILLILGCTALIFPIACAPDTVRFNGPVTLGVTALLVLLGWTGSITAWTGVPMLAALVGFTWYSYRAERRSVLSGHPEAAIHLQEIEEFEDGPKSLPGCLLALLGGFAAVVAGSHFLVVGAVGLARSYGVSEETIGLTLVAVGTSLPELATSVVAAYRRQSEVALGNVMGSNIFNILGILGVVPLFGSLPVPPRMAVFDLSVMLGITAFFVVWTMVCNGIGRRMAVLLLLGYAVYVACQYFGVSAMHPSMA